MKPWLIAAVVIVAVIVLVVRRLRGEPLVMREVFAAPLILVAIGVYSLTKLDLGVKEVLWIALGAVIGLGFGAVRATTAVLFERDGVLWQHYTGRTFAILVCSFAVNFGVGLLATASGVTPEARPRRGCRTPRRGPGRRPCGGELRPVFRPRVPAGRSRPRC